MAWFSGLEETLNQRVQGSSPCAPTKKYQIINSLSRAVKGPGMDHLLCPTNVRNTAPEALVTTRAASDPLPGCRRQGSPPQADRGRAVSTAINPFWSPAGDCPARYEPWPPVRVPSTALPSRRSSAMSRHPLHRAHSQRRQAGQLCSLTVGIFKSKCSHTAWSQSGRRWPTGPLTNMRSYGLCQCCLGANWPLPAGARILPPS
jgi:hypothetical protein